jgi:hypothetical protein
LHRLPLREIKHRELADVEPGRCDVDREHVDRRAVERELPARPAAGRVPACDSLCAADIGPLGERPKGRVTLGKKAIRAAGDVSAV